MSRNPPKNSTRKAKSKLPTKSFLDTSVVYKLQIGASAQQEHLSETIPKEWYVNNYVKMEFYRTCLMHWIELYFESESSFHSTFGDALKYFAEKFGRVPKVILSAISSMLDSDGFSTSDAADKAICRQKLQDLIFELAAQLEKGFKDTGQDPTKCARIRKPLKLPEAAQRDEVLRDLAVSFHAIGECRSKCQIHGVFENVPGKQKMAVISAISPNGRSKEALEKIQKAVAKAVADPNGITCRSCGNMGDAIIAVTLNAEWKLNSMDYVHEPIAIAVDIEYEIHPSLVALQNQKGAPEAATQ